MTPLNKKGQEFGSLSSFLFSSSSKLSQQQSSTISTINVNFEKYQALIYCILLALQFGLQPIIASKLTPAGVSKSSVVIATEIAKIAIAFVSLLKSPKANREDLMKNWNISDSLKVALVPASLYAIQNLFMQYGYQLLDSMTFNLLNQTKTLSAAFWLWIVLGYTQSVPQMFALFLLLGAALLLTTGGSRPPSSGSSSSSSSVGLAMVAAASLISGLSGALTQRAMSRPGLRKANPFFFSAEMAVFGILFLILNLLTVHSDIQGGGGLFSNWTPIIIVPVLANAVGGLLVGLVTLHSGGVVKGFSLIAGIIITGLAQFILDGKPLGIKDLIGVVLVSSAIYLHSSYPPSTVTKNPVVSKDD